MRYTTRQRLTGFTEAMNRNAEQRRGGLGFLSALFLLFLGLKLTGTGSVAHWSWWWVTAPLWAPPVLVLGPFLMVMICIIVYYGVQIGWHALMKKLGR